MAEHIDEARIIAWVDGELTSSEAAEIEAAVEKDPALAALAERHRRLKVRFSAAFAAIAGEPVEARPVAPVVSLAAARAEREARNRPTPVSNSRRWGWPGSIAASLLVGALVGHQMLPPPAVSDRPGALRLDRSIATALDRQLSGDRGPIRVALSFRDRQGAFCRSFTGANLSGVACRAGGSWSLRYGAPGQSVTTTYRTAGNDGDTMAAIGAIIAGEPLDRAQEVTARKGGWR